MGFFSDLREDLSQAVNELIPAEEQIRHGDEQDTLELAAEAEVKTPDPVTAEAPEPEETVEVVEKPVYSLEEMLENIDNVKLDEKDLIETEDSLFSRPESEKESAESSDVKQTAVGELEAKTTFMEEQMLAELMEKVSSEGLWMKDFTSVESFEEAPEAGKEPGAGEASATEESGAGEEPVAKEPEAGEEPASEEPEAGEEPASKEPEAGEVSVTEESGAGEESVAKEPKAGEEPEAGEASVTEESGAGEESVAKEPVAEELPEVEKTTVTEEKLPEKFQAEDIFVEAPTGGVAGGLSEVRAGESVMEEPSGSEPVVVKVSGEEFLSGELSEGISLQEAKEEASAEGQWSEAPVAEEASAEEQLLEEGLKEEIPTEELLLEEHVIEAVNETETPETGVIVVEVPLEESKGEVVLEEQLPEVMLTEAFPVMDGVQAVNTNDVNTLADAQEQEENKEKEISEGMDTINMAENSQEEENKGVEETMETVETMKTTDVEAGERVAADETAVITSAMTIKGDIVTEGSIDVIGTVNGNIESYGKLNITGHIVGNSKAAEIYAEGAKINGEIISEGAVKIGASSVIIGNISATSAVIAGAVKGDIDVKGPVILDTSAIVMGNIKSKSVQINNGAVIEGMCSQCYADVSPTAFFDEYKPEPVRKTKSK